MIKEQFLPHSFLPGCAVEFVLSCDTGDVLPSELDSTRLEHDGRLLQRRPMTTETVIWAASICVSDNE